MVVRPIDSRRAASSTVSRTSSISDGSSSALVGCSVGRGDSSIRWQRLTYSILKQRVQGSDRHRRPA